MSTRLICMKSRLIPKEVSRVKRQASLTGFLVPTADEIQGIDIYDRAHNRYYEWPPDSAASKDEDHTNEIKKRQGVSIRQ